MFFTQNNTMCKNKIFTYLCFLVFVHLSCITSKTYAHNSVSDTLILSMVEMEDLFLKNNLILIAEKFELEKAEAAILQAKAWPNPEISIDEVQLFTPKDTEEIPGLWNSNFWKNRTFAIEIEQSIPINGERKQQIAFQELEKEQKKIQFTQSLLELRKELRILIAEWNYNQLLFKDIKMHLEKILVLKNNLYFQYQSGQISKVEYFRIEALYHTVLKEAKEVETTLESLENDLKEILVIPFDIKLQMLEEENWLKEKSNFKLEEYANYYTIAEKESIHFKWWTKQKLLSQKQLEIENRKARIPDLKLKGIYDRASATHIDFIGLGLAIELPVFDQNKGNKKIAFWELEKQNVLKEQFNIEWEKQFKNLYFNLKTNKQLLENLSNSKIQEIEQMQESLHENLNLKNISLIEYLDYFEAFKESKENYYSILLETYINYQTLLYLIGQEK